MASYGPRHEKSFLGNDWRRIPTKVRAMLARNLYGSFALVHFEGVGVEGCTDLVFLYFLGFLLELIF